MKGALKGEDHMPDAKLSQDSSGAACSPFLAPAKAASSQRSAGTVSGGAPEVAQQSRRITAPAATSATPSLKRPLASLDLGGLDLDQDSQTSSQGCSKSARSSREATPARRRAAAQRARAAWTDGGRGEESGDEGGSDADSRSGLDFLLKACEMLDPNASAAAHTASLPTPVKRPAVAASAGGMPKTTRTLRAASVEASPAALARRPVSRRLLAREAAEQDGDYVPEADSDWEGSAGGDADYQPSGRPARASTRAQRASARGVAVATASAAAAGASSGGEEAAAPAAPAPAPARGRWGGEPKQLITGPCMNPECEHPFESPQWRKGPPQHPVLCNACGTRWLRNGTLKPLVPRRGLRYKNKPKPPPKGKAAAAATAAQAAASAPLATVPPAAASHSAGSSDASAAGRSSEGEDPAALFPQSQAASLQLPIPPLQATLPSFVPPAAALPAAFNPAAMFGGLDPTAAAAAAAAAFQAAPQMFAGGGVAATAPVLAPWGFFTQPAAPPPPALFQPSPVLKQQESAGATASDASRADAVQQQPSLQSELEASPVPELA